MTKADLVDVIVKASGVSKKVGGDILDAIIDGITKDLKKGNKVTITGFGTFSVRKRNARTGINPRTGKPIKIPAMKVPKFSAGKALKNAVK